MHRLGNEIDIQLYETAHDLIERSDTSFGERRSQNRRGYGVMQKVAPYGGRWFPSPTEFVDVQCYDLTRSGFSFLLPRRPAFESIVASFRGFDETLYLEAEVVRVSGAVILPNGEVEVFGESGPTSGRIQPEATPMLLIGCRFVRRLKAD